MLDQLPTEITISVRVNKQGTLFQAVTAEIVAKVLEEQGIQVPSAWISSNSIKEVGTHEVIITHGTFKRK